MTHALPKVAHEHHDLLMPHVDALAGIADAIGKVPADELADRLASEHRFIATRLVPHMSQAEATLYPELERLQQNRHSMTPMRREHDLIRGMIAEIDELRPRIGEFGVQFRLRRLLFRMHALLKTHLAEEEAYLGVLEHNLSPAEEEQLAQAMAHATAEPR